MAEGPTEDIVAHAILLTAPISVIPAITKALKTLESEGVRVITSRTGAQKSLWIQRRP